MNSQVFPVFSIGLYLCKKASTLGKQAVEGLAQTQGARVECEIGQELKRNHQELSCKSKKQ